MLEKGTANIECRNYDGHVLPGWKTRRKECRNILICEGWGRKEGITWGGQSRVFKREQSNELRRLTEKRARSSRKEKKTRQRGTVSDRRKNQKGIVLDKEEKEGRNRSGKKGPLGGKDD